MIILAKYTIQNKLDTPADDGRHYKGFKSIGKAFKRGVKKVGNLTLDVVSAGTMGEGVIGGITGQAAARTAKAAEERAGKEAAAAEDRATADAAKQAALIAKQEAALDKKRKLADGVASERKNRMNQNQLLSGAETGISSGLLG